MICLGRRVFDAYEEMQAHRWVKNNQRRYELRGKTMGIVGLGNIGKQVAQLSDALGMRILFYDSREVAQEVGETLGWELASTIPEVLARSHVVSLHLSASDWRGQSNLGVIDSEALLGFGSQMDQPGPRILINAARGFIFDPVHLVAAVRAGAIEYACVDVFPQEPRHKDDTWKNPYADVSGIITTPHIGAATQEAQPRIARHVATTTRLFGQQGRVRNCVYSPRFPIGVQEVEGASHVLAVMHSDRRGTKHAIDEAIYDAGVSNLSSSHRDFPQYGVAYDVSAIDNDLTDEQVEGLIRRAVEYTGDETAIRSLRIISLG
jgi:D-3-phosphoglycerate dehydrogenase